MSLLFPAYLAALLGLALPWLLHRFSDQNPPEEEFPSKRFLDATTPPVSRKRTLRYKLLLALRVGSLLLLCLLFAEPWINQNQLLGDKQKHHIVAIDQSLSMRTGDRFSLAIDHAQDLVDDLATSNSLELVGFDNQVRLLASNTDASGSSLDVINDIEPGYLAADYGVLMQRINKIAQDQDLPVKLWLISDFQKSALPAQLNALYAPAVSELEMLSVSGEKALNVNLSAEAAAPDDVNVTVSASLHYTSENPAAEQAIERTVVVEFDNQELARKNVQLPIDQLTVVRFEEFVLPARADPVLRVRLLETDALAEDNEQLVTIAQPNSADIVLLQSDAGSNADARVFVQTALETDEFADVETLRGSVEQVPADTLHLVLGQDVVDSVAIDVLKFVDTGNNALVFNSMQPESLSQAMIDGNAIGEVDDAHPLALGEIDWFGVRFYQLPEFQPQSNDHVLISTDDQQVVLVERSTNRGRLLILNDPLDALASDLPLQPAFVSLMRSIIRYFDASTSIPSQVVAGKRIAVPANIQILNPDDEPLVALGDTSQSSSLELTEPGLYTVLGSRGEQSLRVLLDRQEADLNSLTQSTIESWSARYDATQEPDGDPDNTVDNKADNANAGVTDNVQLTEQSASVVQGKSIWHWILPLLILAMLFESLYANRRLDVRRDGS
ncbi:MAG: VWA domain-containing protein [Granulosicoccus sp.]|nr:VWA domain-containing protein [Granulosicoccus sp.]